ncbi:unnamed protein product [Leptosia nina]|uniref:Peptidase S1 domain-containing protein n=1 Tax=Leptosia nina TaxID=320188 RepID=A0AAV1JLG0_9NEOP
MKSLILISLLVVAASEPIKITTLYKYHETIGIPAAARIKQAEEALDFDGSRIIGGNPSNLGNNPHLGGLVILLTDGRTSACGSSLLSNTKAVTAAHCWTDGNVQARQFTVVLGTVRLFSGGVRVTTTNVVMHPQWNPSTTFGDVAMITMSHVNYNNYIQPIALASGSNNYVGSWAVAAGYGTTSDRETTVPQDTIQREVNLRVISNSECQRTFWMVSNSHLCVATQSGSTCRGDSGGPLAFGTGNGRVLIGITSFGHILGCQRGFPVVFSRVTTFNSWIRGRL